MLVSGSLTIYASKAVDQINSMVWCPSSLMHAAKYQSRHRSSYESQASKLSGASTSSPVRGIHLIHFDSYLHLPFDIAAPYVSVKAAATNRLIYLVVVQSVHI